MRTLTAATARATRRRWAQLTRLLEVTFHRDRFGGAPSSLLVRASDRVQYRSGVESLALALSWEPIRSELGLVTPQAAPTIAGAVWQDLGDISATKDRLAELIRHGANAAVGTYDHVWADAVIKLALAGADADLTMATLVLDELTQLDESRMTARFTGRDARLIDLVAEAATMVATQGVEYEIAGIMFRNVTQVISDAGVVTTANVLAHHTTTPVLPFACPHVIWEYRNRTASSDGLSKFIQNELMCFINPAVGATSLISGGAIPGKLLQTTTPAGIPGNGFIEIEAMVAPITLAEFAAYRIGGPYPTSQAMLATVGPFGPSTTVSLAAPVDLTTRVLLVFRTYWTNGVQTAPPYDGLGAYSLGFGLVSIT